MIEALRSRPGTVRALDALIRVHRELSITPAIVFELYRASSRTRMGPAFGRVVNILAEHFRTLPFDRDAALLAAKMDEGLRERGEEVPFLDLFIASSALVWGDGTVITGDVRHFRRLSRFGLTVLEA